MTLDETALAPDVVWVGSLPGLMCRGADQVRARLAQIRASGRTFEPEVLAERGDVLLVDPHVDPPAELNPTLHQIAVLAGRARVRAARLSGPRVGNRGVRGDAVVTFRATTPAMIHLWERNP